MSAPLTPEDMAALNAALFLAGACGWLIAGFVSWNAAVIASGYVALGCGWLILRWTVTQ